MRERVNPNIVSAVEFKRLREGKIEGRKNLVSSRLQRKLTFDEGRTHYLEDNSSWNG